MSDFLFSGKKKKKNSFDVDVNQQMSRAYQKKNKEPPGVVVVMVEEALGYRIESGGFLFFRWGGREDKILIEK